MSLVFLWLKATKVFETPYDHIIMFVLVDLDLLVIASFIRLWLYHTGR